MATYPDSSPDRIEPQAPPEAPTLPDEPGAQPGQSQPLEAPPSQPDVAEPQAPDEIPAEQPQ